MGQSRIRWWLSHRCGPWYTTVLRYCKKWNYSVDDMFHIASNSHQEKISPISNLMYYVNNSPDIFSPPESTRICAHTEYNYYYNKWNLRNISTVTFSPPRPSGEFGGGKNSLAEITHYMVITEG